MPPINLIHICLLKCAVQVSNKSLLTLLLTELWYFGCVCMLCVCLSVSVCVCMCVCVCVCAGRRGEGTGMLNDPALTQSQSQQIPGEERSVLLVIVVVVVDFRCCVLARGVGGVVCWCGGGGITVSKHE